MKERTNVDKESIEATQRAVSQLETDCDEKIRILHVRAARRSKTGEAVYRIHAALERSPNIPSIVVGVDAAGRTIDLRQLAQEEGRDIFVRTDIDVVRRKLRPAQAGTAPSIAPAQNELTLRLGDVTSEVITVTVPRVPGTDKLDVYFLADVGRAG